MLNKLFRGVAFVGPLRSGKSTMAHEFLLRKGPFQLISFAAALKEEAARAVAVDEEDYNTVLEQMYDPNVKHRWRTLLQVWGTEVRRDIYGEDYWVNKVEQILKDDSCFWFNDDCRYQNEYDMLRAHSFAFVRCLPQPNDEALAMHNVEHTSEQEWSRFEVDLELPWATVKERVRIVEETILLPAHVRL